MNNPILMVDPTGMAADTTGGKSTGVIGPIIDVYRNAQKIESVQGLWQHTVHTFNGGNYDGYQYDRQGNVIGYSPITGIAPTPGMMKANPKDILKIVSSIRNFLSTGKKVGTALSKGFILQGFKVTNHAWRKSGLGRGATEELVNGVIEGAKKAGTVVTEFGTGKFSGNIIKVFNHNGVKVAVDESRKLIMSIRPEKGFLLP